MKFFEIAFEVNIKPFQSIHHSGTSVARNAQNLFIWNLKSQKAYIGFLATYSFELPNQPLNHFFE